MSGAFVDTDVVISSLISQKGAAFLLLENKMADFMVSNVSEEEILEVAKRLKISLEKTKLLIKKLRRVEIKDQTDCERYVSDPGDTHIIAGARNSNAKFLITYNSKHCKIDKIKQDLGITVLSPAMFLQWLRSKS